MVTIYYPHFDLVSKGLLVRQNHILNIKLLTLLCDQVLVLPSHLLDVPYDELVSLNNGLSDFFYDGKIVTSIYQGQNGIDDYYLRKIDSINDKRLQSMYRAKVDYALHHFFEEPQIIFRDNEKEKGLFQVIYNEANNIQVKESNNQKLKHSVSVFEEEFYCRSDRKGEYLTIQDVQELTEDLIKTRKIYKAHQPFFLKNMIGAYYYCGSLANSAITAYNPYFIDIAYDKFSGAIPYKSNKIYSPDFLLDILMGLKVISDPSDILLLSSKDIDFIKHHKAWIEFRDNYYSLCGNIDDFQRMINFEVDKQKKIDKLKRIIFGVAYGLADIPVSAIVGLITQGSWGIATAIGILLLVGNSVFAETKLHNKIQHTTTDMLIDKLKQSKEPLYVISKRIGYQVEKELSKKNI